MSLKIFTFEFFSNFTLDLFQVIPFATTQKDEGGQILRWFTVKDHEPETPGRTYGLSYSGRGVIPSGG